MKKRIVIPTDFSDNAWTATEYGLQLAAKTSADILVIHAYDRPKMGATSMISIVEQLQKDAEAEMSKIRKKIEGEYSSLAQDVTYRCIQGSIESVLAEYTAVHGNELVVMGTEGASGLERHIFGSNATAVIKNSNYPVMVIPPNCQFELSNGVSCGLDEKVRMHEADAQWLKELVRLSDSKVLSIVNVLDQEEMNTESLLKIPELLSDLDVEVVEQLNDDVVSGLDEYVKSSNTDCLILVRKRLNFFEKLFHFSVSRDVATIITKPLLIIRSAS